jgi:uncharacterized protein
VTLADPPAFAAWRHVGSREGFELAFFATAAPGWRIEGATTAAGDGAGWFVRYEIDLDASWRTRGARISGRTATGSHAVVVASDGDGHWTVDGAPAPRLDGCLDVDLESSALTNALPVRRARLGVGDGMDAPAAYVRAGDLAVERLEQRYERLPDDGPGERYAYAAPVFGFTCTLAYDATGLVLDYPGIATRAG